MGAGGSRRADGREREGVGGKGGVNNIHWQRNDTNHHQRNKRSKLQDIVE